MTLVDLIPFFLILAAASYFQTVTGFGLSMIVMGVASGLDLAPVATMAAVINLVSLVNSAVTLRGSLHHVEWGIARVATLGILPALVAGVLLLEYLSHAASAVLQLLLGAVIVYGGVCFALRPAPLAQRSGQRAFLASGIFSGLLSGLFAMAGPPLIFQFYRQPMSLVTIRHMLILLFTVTSLARTLLIGVQGQLTGQVWLLSALAVPVVAMATLAGRRYPPPFSPKVMRRIVFAVLCAIGSCLMLLALPRVSAMAG